MTYHPQDMDQVQEFGEVVPEDWYHVRVKNVKEDLSKTSNEPTAYLQLVVQDEPFTGRMVLDTFSLQDQALAKAKAYYKATGLGTYPDKPGHDPELLIGGECYVKVQHQKSPSDATVRANIPPWGIKSLADGRPSR